MLPCLAYREFHEQTNTAATTLVVIAEFGLAEPKLEERRQELELHGLIQRGAYEEASGVLLRNALRYLSDAGLQWTVLHDPERVAALQEEIGRRVPDFAFRFIEQLGTAGSAWGPLDGIFDDDARVLLVEARHSVRGLPVHLLLARRAGHLHVMNSHTGRNHIYNRGEFAAHLESPVAAGAVAFAGSQYLYTGIGVRIWRPAGTGS